MTNLVFITVEKRNKNKFFIQISITTFIFCYQRNVKVRRYDISLFVIDVKLIHQFSLSVEYTTIGNRLYTSSITESGG